MQIISTIIPFFKTLNWPTLFFLSLFILRERERACVHVQGRGREWGERESQAGSVLTNGEIMI